MKALRNSIFELLSEPPQEGRQLNEPSVFSNRTYGKMGLSLFSEKRQDFLQDEKEQKSRTCLSLSICSLTQSPTGSKNPKK